MSYWMSEHAFGLLLDPLPLLVSWCKPKYDHLPRTARSFFGLAGRGFDFELRVCENGRTDRRGVACK